MYFEYNIGFSLQINENSLSCIKGTFDIIIHDNIHVIINNYYYFSYQGVIVSQWHIIMYIVLYSHRVFGTSALTYVGFQRIVLKH